MAYPPLEPLSDEARALFGWVSHQPLAKILDALHAAGGAPMFVGGCVRDSLLSMPPVFETGAEGTDIDIATILMPEATIAALTAAGIKAIPTGIDHGTITAVKDGLVAEVTTLRADIDTDGRHAEVAFTTDWDEDWRRRDFTINALYLSPDYGLFDPAGGQAALSRQSVAFIGEAEKRIEEDYLRILRFYRFSARYAAEIDETGAAACRTLHEGLKQISRERIGQEMMKILAGPRRSFILQAMADDGVLGEVFADDPDLETARRLADGAMRAEAAVMLAALWPKADIGELASALRLSNAQAARVRASLKAAAAFRDQAPDDAAAKVLLYHLGAEAYGDGIALSVARIDEAAEADMAGWQTALALSRRWTPPDFPLSAKDFQARGIEPGPALGLALRTAEGLWVEAGFPVDARSLAGIADSAIQSTER